MGEIKTKNYVKTLLLSKHFIIYIDIYISKFIKKFSLYKRHQYEVSLLFIFPCSPLLWRVQMQLNTARNSFLFGHSLESGLCNNKLSNGNKKVVPVETPRKLQRLIQNPVKHLRWNSFCKDSERLTSVNCSMFAEFNVCKKLHNRYLTGFLILF